MERVLLDAGQFAHLSVGDIRDGLDQIYDPGYRKIDEEKCLGYADAAAHDVLFRAHSSGLCQQLFCPAQTMEDIANSKGALCCLCGRTDTNNHTYGIPDEFQSFVCPRVVCGEYTEDGERNVWISPSAMCDDCAKIIRQRSRRCDYWKSEALWVDILSRLNESPTFRDRVRRNAKTWASLRFDPRKKDVA